MSQTDWYTTKVKPLSLVDQIKFKDGSVGAIRLLCGYWNDEWWIEYVKLAEVFGLPKYELNNIVNKKSKKRIVGCFTTVAVVEESLIFYDDYPTNFNFYTSRKMIKVSALTGLRKTLEDKGKCIDKDNWKWLLTKLYGSVMWHKHSHVHLTPGNLQGFVDKCYSTCRHEFDSGTRPLPPLGKVGLTDAAMLLQCFDAEGYPNVHYLMEICKLTLIEVTKEGFIDSSSLAGMRKLMQEYPKELNDIVRHTRSDVILARIGFDHIKEDIRCRDTVVLSSFD